MHLTNRQARHLILHLQGLTLPHHKRLEDDALLALIVQLGFVQLDSIQWVERAHHMILQARSQTYRPAQLKRLHEKRRALFEHWTHDASLIPALFYPYWRHRFARKKEQTAQKFHRWQGAGYADQCEHLLARIEADGALMSRDLERADTGPQEMWQWHDGKAALEYLWHTGELAIAGRRGGFQKVYNLPERVLPADVLAHRISHDEFVDWACRSALERLGFATPSDLARFWDIISIGEAKGWVEDQTGNTLITVAVDGAGRGTTQERIARADIGALVDTLPPLPKRIRALSPFDPVIRDRKRLEWLWGFDYRIEIYVPEAKRRWGYYVFPLLEGDNLIGRIDMKADRKADALAVKNLWWENGREPSNARRERLRAELVRQARFAGVKNVTGF